MSSDKNENENNVQINPKILSLVYTPGFPQKSTFIQTVSADNIKRDRRPFSHSKLIISHAETKL